ncbi:MAG: thioredoxin family protein [Actinomycetota bacterium]
MTDLTAIDNFNFIAEVIHADRPVILDCWARWCGPCLRLAPELELLAAELPDRLKVAKLDTDQNPEIAQLLGVQVLPTLVLFVDGVVVATATGYRPKEAVLALFEPHLPKVKPGG